MKSFREIVLRVTLAVVLFVAPALFAGAPFSQMAVQGLSSPQEITGLSAWYDISDLSSLRNNAGAVPGNGDTIKLVGDKSGNSAVNVLCLNGVSGNYASTPSAAGNRITGDIDIVRRVALVDWTPAAQTVLTGKWVTAANMCYFFDIASGSTGVFRFFITSDGTAGTQSFVSSSVAPTIADMAALWVRVTRAQTSGDTKFYTCPDQVTVPTSGQWTQLGTTQTLAAGTAIFDSATAALNMGANGAAGTSGPANMLDYYGEIRSTIGGSAAQIFNPGAAAKLATSLVSSTGETWTINTSGDLGARICGARDLYQFTSTKQPVLTIAATGNYLTFDGSDDYMKAAASAQAQPVTRLTAGSQVTWTSGDYLWDGASAANTGALIQTTTTPQLNLNAGSSVAANTDFALNTGFIFTEVINGASSSLQANKLTATTGNAGAGVPNGITIGASGASTAANFGNITLNERVSYGSLTADQIASVRLYMARKWSITGGF